ncbi:phosphate acetyltransferase [bacterium]|nr:phosphate acetyltransferase [bacterium]
MSPMQRLRELAKSRKQKIVLPEGHDARVIKAAREATDEGIAEVVILGDEDDILRLARENSVDLEGIEIINPKKSPKLEEYAKTLYELRKHKGVSMEKAYEMASSYLYYGVLMVYSGDADGEVSGATHPTSDTFRPALQVIKCLPEVEIASAFFAMVVPDSPYGENGFFLFADSGLVIDPNPRELAQIAISTADTMRTVFGYEPRVALLSFSTKGSASHPLVDKVVEATKIAKERRPDILLDGELQVDAAIIPWVAEKKAPGSPVGGRANVLIFPDLNAGNIAYKLVQRLAKAEAYGPIAQGLCKPINDLSRGCSVEDIVNVIIITSAQSLALKGEVQ